MNAYDKNILRYEVNFLTGNELAHSEIISSIVNEFDFIRMCQGMIKPFGFEARKTLDRFIALSLRKLLCDKQSLLRKACPDFMMPPLSGCQFDCPGENNEMKLYELHPDILIKPQDEWIPLDDWLQTKIAWIEKGVGDIPDAYEDQFFHMIEKRIGDRVFGEFFEREVIEKEEQSQIIWRIKDPLNKKVIYDYLKSKGYYDLTIERMIKTIADKKGAHLDVINITWTEIANSSKNINQSAISCFATQMIYATTKQLDEMKDYFDINLMLETP